MDRPAKHLPDDVASIMPMQGHVFEGKYRIVNLIGAGGFARVFHARFEDVDRDVALKVLVPQSGNPANMYPDELVQRFHREARAVSDLRSPNTITLHDFGRTRNGLLYMIFEYIDGTPLDRLVKHSGPIPASRVVHILSQLLASLREAHAVGMLHRDIKPANVMVFDYLDHRDQVKLLDFGIAKTWTHGADGQPISDDLTEDGTVMGTPRYMSPEQIVGQRLGPASDIYSLGLVIYEMLVGVPAAPQTQKTDVVRRHLGPEPFVLPQELQIPAGLRGIVGRMVSKDIGQRFQTVDEVAAALAGWQQGGAQPAPAAQYQTGQEIDHMAATQATGAPVAIMASQYQNAAPAQSGGASFRPPTSGVPTTGSQQYSTPQYNAPVPQPQHAGYPQPTAPPTGPHGIARPERTFIQVKASPAGFDVDVPMKPTKRTMAIAGVLALPMLLAFVAFGFTVTLFTMLAFGWGLSLVFRTYRLRVATATGYEVTKIIFGQERSKRGPMVSVVNFVVEGTDEEEDTTLKMVTHEGDFDVAKGFSLAELNWVASEGNQWLSQIRAINPNPVH